MVALKNFFPKPNSGHHFYLKIKKLKKSYFISFFGPLQITIHTSII